MIGSFFKPFKELLKQNFSFNAVDVVLSTTINNQIVLGLEGKIGGARRLDVGSQAHHNEGCDSNSSQWMCPHRESRERGGRSHVFANVPLTIKFRRQALRPPHRSRGPR
jgi:hypothetical protein